MCASPARESLSSLGATPTQVMILNQIHKQYVEKISQLATKIPETCIHTPIIKWEIPIYTTIQDDLKTLLQELGASVAEVLDQEVVTADMEEFVMMDVPRQKEHYPEIWRRAVETITDNLAKTLEKSGKVGHDHVSWLFKYHAITGPYAQGGTLRLTN
ncbi:MAG TPA: hypothetical protein VLF94_02920 [Chlamydiales bacterium]|nr:hypothetical protein [Chlamydiales bacterium]